MSREWLTPIIFNILEVCTGRYGKVPGPGRPVVRSPARGTLGTRCKVLSISTSLRSLRGGEREAGAPGRARARGRVVYPGRVAFSTQKIALKSSAGCLQSSGASSTKTRVSLSTGQKNIHFISLYFMPERWFYCYIVLRQRIQRRRLPVFRVYPKIRIFLT